MLNIVIINCDGKYVEYEWNTKDDNLLLLWRNTDGLTVDDLLEECKQELCMKR